jgi:hypothetical protein
MQKQDKINENIERLNTLLEARVSFWRNFLLGIITGIGSVIGAALIGSLLVGLFASNLDNIPILRDLVPTETVQEYIEE